MPVETVAADLEILRVDVEDAGGVVVDDALVVDLEPDEMRRIEVEAEALGRDRLEHLVPHGGRVGDVLAARPFVPAEDHRAVLDRDLHAALLGVADERRPDRTEALEVLGQRERPGRRRRTYRRCRRRARGSVDHLAQMAVRLLARGVVRLRGCSGSRRATRSPGRVGRPPSAHAVGVEGLDVDVADAGVTARAAAAPPASTRPRASRTRSPAAHVGHLARARARAAPPSSVRASS